MDRSAVWALLVLAVVALPVCAWWSWYVTRAFGFERRRRLSTRLTPVAVAVAVLLVLLCQFVGAALAVKMTQGMALTDWPKPLGPLVTDTISKSLVQPTVLFVAAALGGVLGALSIPLVLPLAFGVRCWELGIHTQRMKAALLYGSALVLTWFPTTIVANGLVRALISQREEARHPVERVLVEPESAWMLTCFALATAVVVAPLFEELVFRGLLQTWLCQRIGPDLAILATAILFGAAHSSQWPDPIPLTLFGVALGEAFQRTRSLWAPIALHAGLNAGMTALAIALGSR